MSYRMIMREDQTDSTGMIISDPEILLQTNLHS